MYMKLSHFDVMKAIDEYLKNRGIEWKYNQGEVYDDVWFEFERPVWKTLKHKNGKVVKCEHGRPKREIEKWEQHRECFGEMDNIRIWYSTEDEQDDT